VCAGFDYVRYSGSDHIEVFVTQQEIYRAQNLYFASGETFIAIQPPADQTNEYSYPKALLKETRNPLLFDGAHRDIRLSERHNVSDFACPGYRYLRVDPSMVECLEMAAEEYNGSIEIIPGSAYRVRSVNLNNIDTRHQNEKYRFQSGQAVEIRPKKNSLESLVDLALAVVKTCVAPLRLRQRGIGMGCHSDRLYLDIQPLQHGNEANFIKLWNSGGHQLFLKLLPYVYSALTGKTCIIN
jgi:hypothetical protein